MAKLPTSEESSEVIYVAGSKVYCVGTAINDRANTVLAVNKLYTVHIPVEEIEG